MSINHQFDYPLDFSPDMRLVSETEKDGVSIQNLTFNTPFGYRRAAYLLSPAGQKPNSAVIFAHWLETWDPSANRRQFLDQATRLAAGGAACLLVETMWSDQDWFIKRTQADDIDNAIRQVVELRVAFDLLLAQTEVAPSRLVYVGHDFGGMYGVLAGSVDLRPSFYVIMAATPRFSDWFLYYPPLAEPERAEYTARISPYDPINRINLLAPSPVLFQFADDDHHVPKSRAEEFFAAALEPKEIRWYSAGHGLNAAAGEDRIRWITEKLGLS